MNYFASDKAPLIQAKIAEEGLSVREASRQIGIAHTTLYRIFNGLWIDKRTEDLVNTWLCIITDKRQYSVALERITYIFSIYPALKTQFEELAIDKLIDNTFITDALTYIAYGLHVRNSRIP